jgi:citrate/tricarballylate utilization protein
MDFSEPFDVVVLGGGNAALCVAISLPVVLGILGGLGLLIGPAGLFGLAHRRDSVLVDGAHRGMDTALIAMLFLTSLTGFL